ncbi:myosin-3-like [Anopheles ziemanni]|uniref:myosin-3-like n=1 Tax=Anopheles ziemanni TaxID=345580 RepID=UPI00265E8199|nr:myosin-3-like [Anopheles ziemanni]
MDIYEENLLRLNKKIRELMSHIDTLETKNQKLLQENSVLVDDVANFRVQHAIAEEGRLRCKSVLEKEMARSSEQFEAQKLLKKRYNDLIKEYVAQNQKLRTYESQDNAKPVLENRKRVPVEIIGTLSDIGKPKAHEEKVAALENRCAKLEKELYKAYAIIDDLEFDLESIDHLEETNQRLEKQIRELKAELAQGCRCAPPTPTSANSVSSPLPGDSIYTFESIETTEHGSQQDESKALLEDAVHCFG